MEALRRSHAITRQPGTAVQYCQSNGSPTAVPMVRESYDRFMKGAMTPSCPMMIQFHDLQSPRSTVSRTSHAQTTRECCLISLGSTNFHVGISMAVVLVFCGAFH